MLAAAITFFADTLVLVATEAAEEESSKTVFYILGGLAAVWAIALFAIGMRSSTFPGSPAVRTRHHSRRRHAKQTGDP